MSQNQVKSDSRLRLMIGVAPRGGIFSLAPWSGFPCQQVGPVAGQAVGSLSSLSRRDGVPSPLCPTEFSRRGAALATHGGELDQIRPFGEVSDEPEQSQDHEKDDEQQQAVPRSGLWLRAINPVKFHWRVPHPFQPLRQGAHPRIPSVNLVRLWLCSAITPSL
jgi:hypothetical protein